MTKISTQLFKKIRRIQVQATHLATESLAGAYRSAFRGQGMEFEEVREYQPGDEIRTIDWNVTARMNRPYVKSFREEREMTVILAVDISSSTRYGSGQEIKSDLIAEIAAVIAFSAIKNNDKIALLLFSNKVEKYFPPKKGIRHILRIIRELLIATPRENGTDINEALNFIGKVQSHTSICFLLSDFICSDYSFAAAHVAKRHDLISLALLDPSEKQFPPMDLVSFIDLETGEKRLIDTASPDVQQPSTTNFEKRLEEHKKVMHTLGADFVTIRTDHPYLPQLQKFFHLRKMRRR